jgi:hypothetical protein
MKLNQIIFFVILLFAFSHCVPLEQQAGQSSSQNSSVSNARVLKTTDHIYLENIKTVLLYPFTGNKLVQQINKNGLSELSKGNRMELPDPVIPPILPITQQNPLVLEFDEIGSDVQSYYTRVIHCNADWSESSLISSQYLDKYNEFFISERNASFNTRLSYVHYKFYVPKVKISGNYIIAVYRNNDVTDIVLTKRFIVYENNISITPQVKFSMNVGERDRKQQVDFVINYGSYDILNPLQNLKVMVRQNHRWDNIINGLKPTFVKDDIRRLEYVYFNGESDFYGKNEFRALEIKSIRFSGINVLKTITEPDKIEVLLKEDRNRNHQAYGLEYDINGKYLIIHYESGDTETQPEYIFVNFFLKSEPLNGKVYVLGEISNWRSLSDYELTYDETRKGYTGRILLKQGIYNYQYGFLPSGSSIMDEVYFEGSHSVTQNVYDIIAYYRPPGTLTDLVIGYASVNYNGR